MNRLEVVDLFSGLGGFSQAFVDRGHNVERYDYDKKFKDIPNTIIKDVGIMTPIDIEHANIILIGFPCEHFSAARAWETWPKGIPAKHILPTIKLLKKTIKIVKISNVEYWILENPQGMMRKIMGKPDMVQYWSSWGAQYLKPTHLWGKLPPVEWRSKDCYTWERAPRGSKKGIQSLLRNPAQRALIPYEFSLAVCLAVEGKSKQQTLI